MELISDFPDGDDAEMIASLEVINLLLPPKQQFLNNTRNTKTVKKYTIHNKIQPDIFTTRKRSLRRLCFHTCLSVILFTGGLSASVHDGIHNPPGSRHPALPSGSRHPPAQCMLGDTGNKRGGMYPTGMHTYYLQNIGPLFSPHRSISLSPLTLC